jgi:3-oxoacyl-[acyl-carrier-protein] synthase-3
VKYATLGPIAVYFPERSESIEDLRAEFPDWNVDLIHEKTGVNRRYLAAADECSSDLAVEACRMLFADNDIDPASIDFVLLCTQTPDYFLPTTACLLQQRLALKPTTGALDFNLGCSGFVYGLALADGLIRAGSARRILLVTAETYSKFIAREDRSLRTIFGDAAAATLVFAGPSPTLSAFRFGTDGSAANCLIVPQGGFRPKADALKPSRRQRWPSQLYMDGPNLVNFTLDVIPPMVQEILDQAQLRPDDVDFYLPHQATAMMLERLRVSLNVPSEKWPHALEDYGNTVSCTIPILIRDLRADGRIKEGMKSMLIGFGVGFSWAGCLWQETWSR